MARLGGAKMDEAKWLEFDEISDEELVELGMDDAELDWIAERVQCPELSDPLLFFLPGSWKDL